MEGGGGGLILTLRFKVDERRQEHIPGEVSLTSEETITETRRKEKQGSNRYLGGWSILFFSACLHGMDIHNNIEVYDHVFSLYGQFFPFLLFLSLFFFFLCRIFLFYFSRLRGKKRICMESTDTTAT